MFSLHHTGGTANSVDPDEDRIPPPAPTIVYFPQNDINLEGSKDWYKHPPSLWRDFSKLAKPVEVNVGHLQELNIATENDVELEDFIPEAPSGPAHLPPRSWIEHLDPSSRRASVAAANSHEKHLLLSNGAKAPDPDIFFKFASELACETEDGLRAVGRRKPRKGYPTPQLNHYKEFWTRLEQMSQFWDTSLDQYRDEGEAPPASAAAPKKRLSIFSLTESPKPHSGKKYRGWRRSTGSRMPEIYRVEMVKTFIRNIAFNFHCQMSQPRRPPQLEIKNLLIPVTQPVVIWRLPENKDQLKRGVIEGPILGISCRSETAFVKDSSAASLDMAREMAAVLHLAEERAREGKPHKPPGDGKWYTTKPRWGGGPGGEFGEAEGNKDHPFARRLSTPGSFLPRKMTEEEIWKELKPGHGLWDARTTYLAVGKDRRTPEDAVFMVSSIYHHISIVKLEVHPLYIEYLLTGKGPPGQHPDASWCRPVMYRTKWFDMLTASGRLEAYRGIWGVMSYMMRSEQVSDGRSMPARQLSDSSTHHFSFRKKSHALIAPLTTQRSHSVA